MAFGRQQHDWAQTSQVLCMIYSVNRSKNSRKLSADDFNPFALKRKGSDVLPGKITDLKMFVPK